MHRCTLTWLFEKSKICQNYIPALINIRLHCPSVPSRCILRWVQSVPVGWCRLPVRLTRDSSVLPALPCDEIDVEKPDMTATLFNNADVVSREFAARPTKKIVLYISKLCKLHRPARDFSGWQQPARQDRQRMGWDRSGRKSRCIFIFLHLPRCTRDQWMTRVIIFRGKTISHC